MCLICNSKSHSTSWPCTAPLQPCACIIADRLRMCLRTLLRTRQYFISFCARYLLSGSEVVLNSPQVLRSLKLYGRIKLATGHLRDTDKLRAAWCGVESWVLSEAVLPLRLSVRFPFFLLSSVGPQVERSKSLHAKNGPERAFSEKKACLWNAALVPMQHIQSRNFTATWVPKRCHARS